jgi:hypothetical protein
LSRTFERKNPRSYRRRSHPQTGNLRTARLMHRHQIAPFARRRFPRTAAIKYFKVQLKYFHRPKTLKSAPQSTLRSTLRRRFFAFALSGAPSAACAKRESVRRRLARGHHAGKSAKKWRPHQGRLTVSPALAIFAVASMLLNGLSRVPALESAACALALSTTRIAARAESQNARGQIAMKEAAKGRQGEVFINADLH